MKNVQISLMIFILSLLLLSCSQSIFQTVIPTKYSLHFTNTHSATFNHILTSQNMSNRRFTQRYWGVAFNSNTMAETSDVVFNNAKITILYRMIQFKIMSIGCQLFKFEN